MSTISILKNIVLGGFLYGFDIYTDIFFANEMMNNFKNYVTLTTEYEECKMKKAESNPWCGGDGSVDPPNVKLVSSPYKPWYLY